jgi:hypothetical protein
MLPQISGANVLPLKISFYKQADHGTSQSNSISYLLFGKITGATMSERNIPRVSEEEISDLVGDEDLLALLEEAGERSLHLLGHGRVQGLRRRDRARHLTPSHQIILFFFRGWGEILMNNIMVRILTKGMQVNTEMGVTEIILAKIYGVCELSSHSRGIEF